MEQIPVYSSPTELIGDCIPQCLGCVERGYEGFFCTCGEQRWCTCYMTIQEHKIKHGWPADLPGYRYIHFSDHEREEAFNAAGLDIDDTWVKLRREGVITGKHGTLYEYWDISTGHAVGGWTLYTD